MVANADVKVVADAEVKVVADAVVKVVAEAVVELAEAGLEYGEEGVSVGGSSRRV